MPLTSEGFMKPPDPTPEDDEEEAFFVPGDDGAHVHARHYSAVRDSPHEGPGSALAGALSGLELETNRGGEMLEEEENNTPQTPLKYRFRVFIHEATGFDVSTNPLQYGFCSLVSM
eukprot:205100-Rhodomonas_salina.2